MPKNWAISKLYAIKTATKWITLAVVMRLTTVFYVVLSVIHTKKLRIPVM